MNDYVIVIGCLLLVLMVAVVESAVCPCQDPSLCEPVSKPTKKEVFMFSVNNKNWRKYNWDKLTTLAHGYTDPELMCYAHSRKTRVVAMANFPVANLTNAVDRSKWVSQQVQHCKDNFLDGVNVDFESAIAQNQQDVRDGLTSLVKELVAAFRSNFKHSQVTFDVAWSADCIDIRCYDHAALAEALDFVFVMQYDTRSQIYDECIAWANAPLNKTEPGLKSFLNLGIPAEKLVLGVPWYGYVYPCINYTQDNKCYIASVPFRGVNCSDAAGKEMNYPSILGLLPSTTTGLLWDNDAQSPYFSYKDKDTCDMYQVWYDNPISLTYKYERALQLGLRGVGAWNADALDYSDDPRAKQETAVMWDILPSEL